MEFKDAVKQIQLNERTVGEVADGWEAFRNRYTSFIRSKGPDFANKYAEQWLGDIDGFKGVDNLKSRLDSIGVKLEPKVDDILFKVVDRINASNMKDIESKKNRQQEIEKSAAERQEKLKNRRVEVVQREAEAEAREAKLAATSKA
jgi:hypothetical protein